MRDCRSRLQSGLPLLLKTLIMAEIFSACLVVVHAWSAHTVYVYSLVPRPFPVFQCCTLLARGPGIRSHVRDVTRREIDRRETYQQAGCIKGHRDLEGSCHQRWRGTVQTLAVECSTILLVHKRVAIEEL